MTDPERLGGIAWLERTNGSLTRRERWRLVGPILRGQAQGVAGRLALLAGRRATSPTNVPAPPDSALARAAVDAAADQPSVVLGHSYRTWAFGRALATIDGERGLDDELFYVTALLHDAGLVEAVTGEDFTLRGAAAAASVVAEHRPDDVDRVRDAISAHVTPGATVAEDGPEAVYVQLGATLDLGGLRLHHLDEDFVDAVVDRHPRAGLVDDITGRIAAEAEAVPDGRFALLRRTGFTLAIRYSPLPA